MSGGNPISEIDAGRGGALEGYVGDITKYVVNKAGCRVIVTAPPARAAAADPMGEAAEQPTRAGARIV